MLCQKDSDTDSLSLNTDMYFISFTLFLQFFVTVECSTPVYSSCLAALLLNDYNTSTYQIQPLTNGNIATVVCSFVAGGYAQIEIDASGQQDVIIRTTSLGDFATKDIDISYSTLNFTELREIVLNSGNCSQDMYLKTEGTISSLLSFKFLDETIYNLHGANDGFCKCITSEVCTNDKTKKCIDTGSHANNQNYLLSGKLSVFSKRLPLVRITYGDLNDAGEWAKHIVKPLKCRNKIDEKIRVLSKSKCNQDVNVLIDKDRETCIEIAYKSYMQIQFPYFQNINIISSFNNTLSVTIYSKLLNQHGKVLLCKKGSYLNFYCQQRSNEIFIDIFHNNLLNSSVKLCEIETYLLHK
ncbi:unnamed protein product [Dimorphilus gyrociliatus]|uniref:Uncharacterized protein n=1 Tax=Dimorphilus gyrociliatus TaxID=2664684 RepID=A0A7I8WFG6_9ANNE|nr:unnamed protein product [Dimorphilus gyrociliatus]